MNSLRVPVTLLIIVVVGFSVWFWFSRPASAPVSSIIPVATSSASAVAPAPNVTATSAPTLDPATVAQNMVGSWQSTDDGNYSVAITSAGKWTDSYRGADASSSTSESGTYVLFTSANPDKDFTGTVVPGVVYLKVTEGKSTLYYSVLEASADQLQLSYLDRGNTLSFVKVQ